jgi:soluble lytic murein transglycosylase-like protein
MWRESRLLPDIDNPTTGATGLIQFMPETAKNLGTTTSALKKMSRAEQMKYVEKYFDSVGLPKGANLGEIYSYVFLPGVAKKSSNGILASRNDPATAKYYNSNQGLDVNRDGIITVSDLAIAAGGQVPSGPVVASSHEGKADEVQSAQINSIAAIQSVSRMQQQINAVSTEAIKLRQKVKEQDDFPQTSNQDMEQYA